MASAPNTKGRTFFDAMAMAPYAELDPHLDWHGWQSRQSMAWPMAWPMTWPQTAWPGMDRNALAADDFQVLKDMDAGSAAAAPEFARSRGALARPPGIFFPTSDDATGSVANVSTAKTSRADFGAPHELSLAMENADTGSTASASNDLFIPRARPANDDSCSARRAVNDLFFPRADRADDDTCSAASAGNDLFIPMASKADDETCNTGKVVDDLFMPMPIQVDDETCSTEKLGNDLFIPRASPADDETSTATSAGNDFFTPRAGRSSCDVIPPPSPPPGLLLATDGDMDSVAARADFKPQQACKPLTDTTMMLRNLPKRLAQRQLVAALDGNGFSLCYDLVYMPAHVKTGQGHGFAFVNFLAPHIAELFRRAWDGSWPFPLMQTRPLSVTASSVQGFEANTARWAKSKTSRLRDAKFAPLQFRGVEANQPFQ